ncbi:MAG: FadR family transcriptional regulator [Clostridia bacterium]|nr:FadR family transcriptional regulator [Clostridia bacterium]
MPTNKPRLADRVADELQMLIMNNYRPGDRLPIENELAEQFSVSRITIREAIRQLNTMGMVDVRQGDGTFVKELTPSSFMKPMLPMLALSNADVEDVFEVRLLIECKAVEYAAQRARDEELASLRTLVKEMEDVALAGDIVAYNEADARFHNAIAQCGHNPVISVIGELINDMIKESILRSCNTPGHILTSVVYHNRICQALCERDASEAMRLMSEHLLSGLAFVKQQRGQS